MPGTSHDGMIVLISIRSLDVLSVLGLSKIHVPVVKFAITLCFWSAILLVCFL